MKHHAQQSPAVDISRAQRRLLQALSEPGARAAISEIEADTIIALAVKNGVTVVRARLPARAAASALAEGLVAWEADGATRRLRLTEAGRAHLRRLAADGDADPFRAQHSPLEARALEKGARPVLVNDGESPLAWLARRKGRDGQPFLDRAQIDAGGRFRRDIEQAQLLQRVTANWEATVKASSRGAASGGVASEAAMDARKRLSCAFEAVGPDLAGLLTDVCGYLKGLEIVESERGWPARSGKVVLRIALDRLTRHYGLATQARGPARSRETRHWGAEDYRPNL